MLTKQGCNGLIFGVLCSSVFSAAFSKSITFGEWSITFSILILCAIVNNRLPNNG